MFGGFTAVNQVLFELQQDEILRLIDTNGSGESTTFERLFSGEPRG